MSNTITKYVPDMLKMGMLALRENTIFPKIVNTSYSAEAANRRGSTMSIPLPGAHAAATVTPATAQVSDVTPTEVTIDINKWKTAGFLFSDKERKEMESGVLPMEASECIRSIGNEIDDSCIDLHTKFNRMVGTGGTTPDGVDDITAARKALNLELAPKDNRAIVWNSNAEAKMLQLNLFVAANSRGNDRAITEGEMGRVLGFDHHADQNIDDYTFTEGTQDGAYLVDQADVAIGDETVNVDVGTGTFLLGAVFTVAGDSQQYVCITSELTGGDDKALAFYPPAKVAWANNAAITFIAAAAAELNLALHRDAIILVTRPLITDHPAVVSESISDPISGLTLRLEVRRDVYQTTWNFDVLWGVGVGRRGFGCRILG